MEFNTLTANNASSTLTWKHDVWYTVKAPETTNFATATSVFDADNYGLNDDRSRAFKIYSCTSDTTNVG